MDEAGQPHSLTDSPLLKRRWGWSQSKYVHYGEIKNLLPLLDQTPNLAAHRPVTIPKEISWFHKNYAVAL
jgi:hypothetical protein